MQHAPSLSLDPIHGPPLRPVRIDPTHAAERPYVLGRSSGADAALTDPEGAVSRTHASVSYFQGEPFPWRIRDLGSRHGTWVNGQRLDPADAAAISPGDQVRIGPWVFRVVVGVPAATKRLTLSSDEGRVPTALMQKIGEQPLAPGARTRLALLMRCAAEVVSARSEAEIAGVALDALLEGTGLSWGAVVRLVGVSEVEVVLHRGPGEAVLSRSMMAAAADPQNAGQTIVLDVSRSPVHGQSLVALDIAAAVCIPIMVERMPPPRPEGGFVSGMAPRAVPIADAFVYLDARGAGTRAMAIDADTVAFCQAVAKVSGLAMSNLQRAAIEEEDHRRQSEIEAARDVQRIIMPPSAGSAGGGSLPSLRYQMQCVPGRYVAGDLFDFVRIEGGRVGVMLGDVVGKGVAAGMVMANVQAHLSRLLRQSGDPAATATEVNRLVAGYSERLSAEHGRVSLFVSLLALVIDLATGDAHCVDAGHGYALLVSPRGTVEPVRTIGGTPLGVAPDTQYQAVDLRLDRGARLVMYSDGLAEQRSALRQPFGVERAAEALRGTRDPAGDVSALLAALRTHSGLPETVSYADDVTIASIAYA